MRRVRHSTCPEREKGRGKKDHKKKPQPNTESVILKEKPLATPPSTQLPPPSPIPTTEKGNKKCLKLFAIEIVCHKFN